VWDDLTFGDLTKNIQPQWYIPWSNVPDKTRERLERFRVGFCDVASPTNERALTAAVIPSGVLCGHKVPTITFPNEFAWAYVPNFGVLNSFTLDFLVRKKAGRSMTFTIFDSLPIPRLRLEHPAVAALARRVLRLTCTGTEMNPFWNGMAKFGWVEPVAPTAPAPGLLDEEERLVVAAEIEVIVARDLFGLNTSEMELVLATFPIVERRQTARFGEYRTRRLVLEGFDELPRVRGN